MEPNTRLYHYGDRVVRVYEPHHGCVFLQCSNDVVRQAYPFKGSGAPDQLLDRSRNPSFQSLGQRNHHRIQLESDNPSDMNPGGYDSVIIPLHDRRGRYVDDHCQFLGF